MNSRRSIAWLVPALCLAGCGAGGGSSTGSGGGGGTGSTPTPSLAESTQAATATAQNNSLCSSISGFTWQIGDGTGELASGTGGTGTAPTADTSMLIASASKWLWGAYVVQLRQGNLTAADIASLTMNTGYASFDYLACIATNAVSQSTETVLGCFDAGSNNVQTSAYVGKYFYSGGNFQEYAAVDLGLGLDNNATLLLSIEAQLGFDIIPFAYDSPQLAAGGQTTANGYAIFLRKILNNQLMIHDLLGADAVCTNPATCPTAIYSPVNDPTSPIRNESWHYSLAHWVEDDPAVGDGAFSSTGAFGFYPWIDQGKTTYGILARYSTDAQAYTDSLRCGREIRKAWFSGQAQ